MSNYLPQVGHAVSARRKQHSCIFINHVAGTVNDVRGNACQIITSDGSSRVWDFRLNFNEWDFEYLHQTEPGA